MKRDYSNIINMEYPFPKKHERMSAEARAAQFSPFAALSGYEEEIDETSRLTEDMQNILEDKRNRLDRILTEIQKIIDRRPLVSVKYFVPDLRKAGGKYVIKKDNIRRIDNVERVLVFCDGSVIGIDSIIDIQSDFIDTGLR